jgi:GntR family transcriptional repressor for pyruvate dehydrogenase complex
MSGMILIPHTPISIYVHRRQASYPMEGSSPIRKVNLSDTIVEHVKSLIAAGRLKPGDKLPPEREFAAQLGVSRTALREALRSLSLMGLLSIRQGDGTFVSRLVPASFMKSLSPMLLMSGTDILELVEARKVIEVKTAALCALRATEEELESVSRLILKMAETLTDLDSFNQLDLEFHLSIARGAHNSALVAALQAVRDGLYEQVENVQRLPGAAKRALDFHCRIERAARARDSEEAERAMGEHLEDVERAILANMAHAPG